MKYLLVIIFTFILYNVNALDAFVKSYTFYTPDNLAYTESMFSVRYSSVKMLNNKNGMQANIGITVIFKQENKIIQYDKYDLLSPIILKSDSTKQWLFDVKRYKLPFGNYNIEVKFIDNNDKLNETTIYNDIIIEPINDKTPQLSDAIFIKNIRKADKNSNPQLVKHELEMEPFLFEYFPSEIEEINIFFEAYNLVQALPEKVFLSKYYIENADSKVPINDFTILKKATTNEVNIFIQSFKIKELKSGNYNIIIEIINKKNQVIVQKKVFFQRNNSFQNYDSNINIADLENININDVDFEILNTYDENLLNEAVEATYPILKVQDQNAIKLVIKSEDINTKKNYLIRFWKATNPKQPKQAFEDYMKIVQEVNNEYGTAFRKGYKTDRGRVFLRYGPPDFKDIQHSTSQYKPHEKWIYYQLNTYGKQSNVFFLFYDPDNTNDYKLLHSTARGEIKEERYLNILHTSYDTSHDNLGREKQKFENENYLYSK